jgi:murein DD-endopeptidase MepM/ murein hydrolase activator NlpD
VDDRGEPRPGHGADAEGYFRFAPPQAANTDYVVFDRPVLAPGPGVVVAARDGVPDNEPWRPELSPDDIAADPGALMGNFVVLDHGGGLHSLLAHCRQGSVAVAVGDRLEGGEAVARVGNSGDSYFPHLHYHVMDGPDLRAAEGLPVHFGRFEVLIGGDRWAPVDDGAPATGEIVRVAEG